MAIGQETRGAGIAEIVSRSVRDGVDPLAALAVAAQEGLGGTPGDNNTSFGPFQLHFGGAYPASAPHDPAAAQNWAWSTAGIDYAIDHIAGVARGQTGPAAVNSIVTNFERPADPQTEISRAVAKYHALAAINPPIVSDGKLASGGLSAITTAGSGSAADAGSADITGSGGGPSALGGALGAIDSVEKLIKFLTSWRFVEVVGGFLLLLVGVALLARQFGLSVPTPMGAAANAVTPDNSTFNFEPGEAQHYAAQPTSRARKTKMQSYTLPADRPASRSTRTPVMSDSIPY